MLFQRRIYWYVLICMFLTCPVLGQDMGEMSTFVRPRVEELRGLKFLRDIEQAYQSVEELQEVLERELEYSYPGDALEVLGTRLLKFGFVVSPIDLRAQCW